MKTFLLMLMLANGSDAALTMRNMQRHNFYESNPLAQPFVHDPASYSAWVAGGSAAEFVSIQRIAKRHKKLAWIIAGTAAAGEAWGITASVKGHR